MAVKCKLSELMESEKYRIEDVYRLTGIDFRTISKLCTLFDCKIEDLLGFVKD